MDYYGDSFQYYYRGHSGTPTVLYPDKAEQLQKLEMTDVNSSISAELSLFFFPERMHSKEINLVSGLQYQKNAEKSVVLEHSIFGGF